ncbi:hypothetical protein CH63R_02248 [Colletotrichum higginsianum IMI 349063]|uniref:Uncharacterized protein n=2 Tax=Colletotrichum higginsianum TaxID=80884 RepID=A0A1B7YNK9_COLHI|nr:hypothetical protein CH63R_02248 [Colletotrichum higginsianum IMI 349063]OBR13522.1 hypothetical protein CH63R_02248 [Colletotrichum higginsianum IMI 349063]TID02774.1 hypothetical protein CH35J_003739 [Colletotrichum higginsianum]
MAYFWTHSPTSAHLVTPLVNPFLLLILPTNSITTTLTPNNPRQTPPPGISLGHSLPEHHNPALLLPLLHGPPHERQRPVIAEQHPGHSPHGNPIPRVLPSNDPPRRTRPADQAHPPEPPAPPARCRRRHPGERAWRARERAVKALARCVVAEVDWGQSGPGCGEFGVGSWEGGETVDVSQFRRLG